MELALNEAKIQAKKLCKAIKADPIILTKLKVSLKSIQVTSVSEIQLKHCQLIISQQLGFENWHNAQLVLSGKQSLKSMPDMGTFFNNHTCNTFVNLWFSSYEEAKLVLSKQKNTSWLLPYKKQFIVVKKEYIYALNISDNIERFTTEINRDLYQEYGSPLWDRFACEVIRKR